jgi:hypothetical protein
MRPDAGDSSLAELYRINDVNLRLRRQMLGLAPEDIRVLAGLAPWAERNADTPVRELYDWQFGFGPTRELFERAARERNISLTEIRAHLEKAQAQYFRQIFQEAAGSGELGVEYCERRLKVGRLHNVINLPLKWYVGSFGLDLWSVEVDRPEHDLSEHYAELKGVVRNTLEETRAMVEEAALIGTEVRDATAETSLGIAQVAQAIREVAVGAVATSSAATDESIAAVAEEGSASAEEVSASTDVMRAKTERMASDAGRLLTATDRLRDLFAMFKLDRATDAPQVGMRGGAARPVPVRRSA